VVKCYVFALDLLFHEVILHIDVLGLRCWEFCVGSCNGSRVVHVYWCREVVVVSHVSEYVAKEVDVLSGVKGGNIFCVPRTCCEKSLPLRFTRDGGVVVHDNGAGSGFACVWTCHEIAIREYDKVFRLLRFV